MESAAVRMAVHSLVIISVLSLRVDHPSFCLGGHFYVQHRNFLNENQQDNFGEGFFLFTGRFHDLLTVKWFHALVAQIDPSKTKRVHFEPLQPRSPKEWWNLMADMFRSGQMKAP